MRVHLLGLLLMLIFVTVSLTEARKKHKWKKEKYRTETDLADGKFRDGSIYKYRKSDDSRSHGYHHMPHSKKAKYHKKDKFGHKKDLTWLNIKKGSECGLECKHGEVCITGPIDTKPLCVRKKDLKKSIKLFHRYQKKEMKAWKQFQKENYALSKYKIHDYGKIKAHDKDYMAERKKDFMKPDMEIQVYKEEEKGDSHLSVPPAPPKVDDYEACSTSQFTQMRTRMMGWFHLLHGQDHLAKKAHEGNIKHFYKHTSVKKELREHDGNKCECLKSAMWQFHQMDKNGDDILDENEISVLGENSLEPCLQPYLTSCDGNADGKFSSNEWCCCFSHVVAPCFKKLDEVRRSGEPVMYMPRCDKEGYFMREQCSGETEESYKCWCVDYNGNEYKGTLTHGRAHCSKIALHGLRETPMV